MGYAQPLSLTANKFVRFVSFVKSLIIREIPYHSCNPI